MMKYSSNNWDFVGSLESVSTASCKTLATFINSIAPNNQPGKSKESRNKIQLPANCIIVPRYIEPRAERGRLGAPAPRQLVTRLTS